MTGNPYAARVSTALPGFVISTNSRSATPPRSEAIPHKAKPRSSWISTVNVLGLSSKQRMSNSTLSLTKQVYRDRPLGFHWSMNYELLEPLDISPAKNDAELACRNAIISELLIAAETGQSVSYSRRKNFYSEAHRYLGTEYTYARVIRAVDDLADAGLVMLCNAPPGLKGWQSTMRARPALLEAVGRQDLGLRFDPHELIRLKDDAKRYLDYADTEFTRQARRDQAAANEMYEAVDIRVDADDVEWSDSRIISLDDAFMIPAKKRCYRVFSRGSFALGGRSYGGFWQSLSKDRRKQLTINGSPVQSHDYSQLHPRILYAERGLSLDGDAYEVPGYERDMIKMAFNTIVNADTTQSAMWAVADSMFDPLPTELKGEEREAAKAIRDQAVAGQIKNAGKLLTAIKKHHDPIKDAFGSGAGLRLQRIDSEMAAYVTRRAVQYGVVALPVHDEFIARQGRDADLVKGWMHEAFERTVFHA